MNKLTWSSELTAAGETDAMDMLAWADRADWALLRMVACVAFATVLLAGASALMA